MGDVNSLKGLHRLRTMHSAKKRSIPRIQISAYLDLYMLNKEKERLLKESKRLGMKDTGIKKRLEEIDLEMNNLEGMETLLLHVRVLQVKVVETQILQKGALSPRKMESKKSGRRCP